MYYTMDTQLLLFSMGLEMCAPVRRQLQRPSIPTSEVEA
jgi:hypothetical protein